MYEELLSNLGLQHVTKYLANFIDFFPLLLNIYV